jgi:hypothetical protein
MEIVIYLALSAGVAWVINQVPSRFLRRVLWIPCMPLLPGLLIVTVGVLVLGGMLRFLDGVARQMEPHDQRRQAPPPPGGRNLHPGASIEHSMTTGGRKSER